MTEAAFLAMKCGVDLNDGGWFVHTSEIFPGVCHEHWQGAVRSDDGLPAQDGGSRWPLPAALQTFHQEGATVG